MLVEYVGRKVARLRWTFPEQGGVQNSWIAGDQDNLPYNKISHWSVDASSGDSSEIRLDCERRFHGDVTQIVTLAEGTVFITGNSGSAHLLKIAQDKSAIEPVQEWPELNDYPCTDAVYLQQSNTVLVSTDGGHLIFVDLIPGRAPRKSGVLSQTAIRSVEDLSENTVIMGNESGHLKIYDIRVEKIQMSLGQQLSGVTCVKKNESNQHIVACGNEAGVLSLWDLRSNATQLMNMSAHDTAISELQYKSDNSNCILTSSFDGQFLKWTMSSASQYLKVDSVMGNSGGQPINSFHVNFRNDYVFTTDNEVLYCGHL